MTAPGSGEYPTLRLSGLYCPHDGGDLGPVAAVRPDGGPILQVWCCECGWIGSPREAVDRG